MRLWLDDVRPAPEGWTHAWTAQEAIDLLDTNMPSEVSLDHDLGASPADGMYARGGAEETGLNVARHIAGSDLPRDLPIRLHTWSPIGAENMRNALEDAGFHAVRIIPYRMGES